MPLNGAILHVGGQSFEMSGNVEITGGVRTGYILDGSGSTFTAVFQSLIESGNSIFGGMDQRKGIYLDLGGGERIVEIEFQGWQGSDTLWAGAAGENPITQMNILERALVSTQIDSFRPATLEYGEFSSSGRFSPVEVAIEGPRLTKTYESPSTFNGTMVCIAVATFDDETYADALSLLP